MKKIHLPAILLLVFYFSCKNDVKTNANENGNTETFSVENNDANLNVSAEDIDEQLTEGSKDQNISSESLETSNAAKKADYKVTLKDFFVLLEASGMSRVEIDTMHAIFKRRDSIAAGEFMAQFGSTGPYKDMNELFDKLDEITAGSDIDLDPMRASMSKENLDQELAVLDTPEDQVTENRALRAEGMPDPSYIEEKIFEKTFYGEKERKETMRKLAQAPKKDVDGILAAHFEVSEQEVNLLKKLPKSPDIRSEIVAKETYEQPIPKEIEDYITSGNATTNFKVLIKKEREMRKNLKAKKFLAKAKLAREKFYNLNPGWHAESEGKRKIYRSINGSFIFLPLGNLSFADRVVSFRNGENGQGKNPNGAIGEPDLFKARASVKMCNLGKKGELILEFTDNAIANVNGPDLYVFEIGAMEPTSLEISKDGNSWINVGRISGGTAMVDISPFVKQGETFNYVRLTDLDSKSWVAGADVDAVAAIGGALRLNLDSAVLFETGKHVLKDEGIAAIKELALQVTMLEKGLITVEGHTDDVGSAVNNETLSQKRAASVAVELKKALPDPNFKWKEVGYGESRPLVNNDSDENRQKNRRVEILVIPN